MKLNSIVPAFLLTTVILLGCQSLRKKDHIVDLPIPPTPQPAALEQTYLKPHKADLNDEPHRDPFGPNAIIDLNTVEYRQISLQECITLAMSDSAVIRDLGVGIVRSPNGMITEMDPAAAFADPRFGEDAALSAFDANFVMRTNNQKNDRANNNRFVGNSNGIFAQDLLQHSVEINKTAVTGTRFALRHGLDYDFNNQAGNRWSNPTGTLPSSKSWLAVVEAEFRQPLLQGGGVMFNRIAGPNSQPGFYNGVLIARSNTEISLARFEQGVRDLISNIENAYWDLHFAYRDLDAAIVARDAAKNFWDESKNDPAVSTLRTASAEEQYLRFEAVVINALEGQLTDGTRTDGGSAGGTFRSPGGVRLAERRLRYLVGMAHTDGVLLMPNETPSLAPITFDWDSSLDQAIDRRAELRQQSWVVKQRQLELTAAKNFMLPRLDLVALHRFRGLGSGLLGSGSFAEDVANDSRDSSAFGDLLSGDFQEWQVGAELSVPLGFRQAHTAVRSAELRLQREKVVLREQQRAVSLALANAMGELNRAYATLEKSNERYAAAKTYEELALELSGKGTVAPDVVLEATRRVFEARQQFNRAQAEYMIAIKNVHFERGTLLDYNRVFVSEAESNPEAFVSANRRAALMGGPRPAHQNDPVTLDSMN